MHINECHALLIEIEHCHHAMFNGWLFFIHHAFVPFCQCTCVEFNLYTLLV